MSCKFKGPQNMFSSHLVYLSLNVYFSLINTASNVFYRYLQIFYKYLLRLIFP